MFDEQPVSDVMLPEGGAEGGIVRPAFPQLAVPGTTVNASFVGPAAVSSPLTSVTKASTSLSIWPLLGIVPQPPAESAFAAAASHLALQPASFSVSTGMLLDAAFAYTPSLHLAFLPAA